MLHSSRCVAGRISRTVTGRPLSSHSRSKSIPMSVDSMDPPGMRLRDVLGTRLPIISARAAFGKVRKYARVARMRRVLPGLILAVACAIAARLLHGLLPAKAGAVIGEVVMAVMLGLLIGNSVALPGALTPGIRFSFHTLVRAAIVILGAQFSFPQVVAIGGKAGLMIVLLMSLALLVAHALGRVAGVPGRLATLIGVGTAVCGNTAITAAAPAIRARDEEVSFAVATNTLFGTVAVFLYPLLGHWLGLSSAAYGTWAGTAVNDTFQVVAAGLAFSDAARQVATAVETEPKTALEARVL